jgi:hypothetical protein
MNFIFKGTRPLGRFRRGSEVNVKMDLKEIGWENVNWVRLGKDQWGGSCEHGNEPSGVIKGGELPSDD